LILADMSEGAIHGVVERKAFDVTAFEHPPDPRVSPDDREIGVVMADPVQRADQLAQRGRVNVAYRAKINGDRATARRERSLTAASQREDAGHIHACGTRDDGNRAAHPVVNP
jgi:hypothetical protein